MCRLHYRAQAEGKASSLRSNRVWSSLCAHPHHRPLPSPVGHLRGHLTSLCSVLRVTAHLLGIQGNGRGAFQEGPVATSPTTLSLFGGSAGIPHRGRKHILRTRLQRQGRERCRMKSLQWPHHAGPALLSGFLPRTGLFPAVEPFFLSHFLDHV